MNAGDTQGRLPEGLPIWLMALIGAASFCAGCSSATKPRPSALPESHDVKILQFFGRDAVITEGAATVLCYGVENAKAVRMDPPVGEIWPALNRCVEVKPVRETRYTLTAEGADGHSVSESFKVGVGANVADLPSVSDFRIQSCTKDYAGMAVFKLSFAAGNAEEISINPPAFEPLHGSPSGEFYVKPSATTTYTLSVSGKRGHVAKRKLTVDISKCG